MPKPRFLCTFPITLVILLSLISGSVFGQDELRAQYDKAIADKDFSKAALYSYTLAKSLLENGDLTNGKQLLQHSITHSKKAGLQSQLLLSTHLLGTALFNEGDFARAADEFTKVATLGKKLNSPAVVSESLLFLGKSLGKTRKFRKAIDALDEALPIIIEHRFTALQLECYQLLSEYHATSGGLRKSAEYKHLHETLLALYEKEQQASERVSALQASQQAAEKQLLQQKEVLNNAEMLLVGKDDSLQRAAESLQLAETSLRALEEANQKRQLEIDLLSKEKELSALRIRDQDSRLENEQMLRNFISVIALLGSALVVVIVINNRKTVKINKKLDLQNKNIRSSINYAKRIQEAMLPKIQGDETQPGESFILFKPRDVVSGDFYWHAPLNEESGQTKAFAFGAIDCTGHGVPGAFMSMIGMNSLNRIVSRGITEPNGMLDLLHREIRQALQQEVSGNNDGMDASLCVYHRDRNLLEFAGAKSPLVYVREGEVVQIKGDLHPIGGSKSKPVIDFKKHEITIDRPTMVYLFTDGFRDQFGGPENQKFMSKRFTQLLLQIHALPLADQLKTLEASFNEWKGKNDQTDDVLVMGVRLLPHPAGN